MPTREIVVAKADSITDGETLKFRFKEGKQTREGFIVGHAGELFAYRNECRHIPVSLDWVENRFFSRDGRYLQCATHGALYEPATGLCIDGPPAGCRLRTLDVAVRDGDIVVTVPRSRTRES